MRIGAPGGRTRHRLIYAGHIDDVEEVGELADDLMRIDSRIGNETRVTQIDLLDVAARRGIAADEKRPVIGRHAVAIQVVVATHIEAEAGVEARDDADLVIIRERAAIRLLTSNFGLRTPLRMNVCR